MTAYKHRELLSQGKNKFILFLQVYAIILVVVGHTPIDGTWVTMWIYEFHMPLFMFISGFLMKYSLKIDYKDINLADFILKKSYRLLIPYFVISLFALGPKILMNNFAMRPVEVNWLGIIQSFVYPWDNSIIFFWFLPTLFIIFIIAASLLKIFKSHIPIAILMGGGLVCCIFNFEFTKFLNLNGVILFFLWWGLGYFYAMYEDKVKKLFKLESHFIAIIYFAFTCIPIFVEASRDYMYIFSLLGILFSLNIGYWYVDKQCNFLNFLNGYSYPIYLFSWFPQIAVRIICIQIFTLPITLVVILSLVLGIFAPVLIAKFVKDKISNKFVKYICGV